MSDRRSLPLRLECRPSKSGNVLIFPYTVQNQSAVDVFAMHAMPSAGPLGGAAPPSETAAIVIADPGGDAVIGKFVAPLPTDRRIAVPAYPLAAHLPAGATLQGRIEIRLPIAETSPYFPDLPLRRYDMIDIKGVVLTIGYWAAGVDNLVALPAEGAPNLFVVVTRDTTKSALRVTQRFPTAGLQLFKRGDAFPRTLG